jgi:hypothetical protein
MDIFIYEKVSVVRLRHARLFRSLGEAEARTRKLSSWETFLSFQFTYLNRCLLDNL